MTGLGSAYAMELEAGQHDEHVFRKTMSGSAAGQKRKRIDFVLATDDSVATPSQPASSRSSDIYWSIVNGTNATQQVTPSTSDAAFVAKSQTRASTACTPCIICGVSLSHDMDTTALVAHEASIPHQASIQHRHPPSAIDRRSRGFGYLSSHGWDPDSHIGLGAKGEGRLDPVKAVEKKDKLGIGVAATVGGSKFNPKKIRPSYAMTKAEKQHEDRARARKAKKYEALIMGRHDVNEYTDVRP